MGACQACHIDEHRVLNPKRPEAGHAAPLQILLFGVMAVEIKRKAPRAHTVLELVRKRWGHIANVVRATCPSLRPLSWRMQLSSHTIHRRVILPSMSELVRKRWGHIANMMRPPIT